jgi:MOSC domain-containing protein YiiM
VSKAILKALNTGSARALEVGGREIQTGIFKQSVMDALELGVLGFANDVQVNRKYHGGPDKAVCAYAFEHYDFWSEVLERELPDGSFGENFTLTSLLEDEVHIGDVFKVGSAQVQISQPRQPCGTLAARFGLPNFVKQVVDSGMTGWYFRVLEPGIVQAGDQIELLEHGEVSVQAANLVMHHKNSSREKIEHLLAQPALSQAWRDQLENRLSTVIQSKLGNQDFDITAKESV